MSYPRNSDDPFDTSDEAKERAAMDILNGPAQTQLKSVVERVERLDQERSEIAEQIKEVLSEAKGNGFDTKIIRKVVAIRKKDRAKRQEEEALIDLYLGALGDDDL